MRVYFSKNCGIPALSSVVPFVSYVTDSGMLRYFKIFKNFCCSSLRRIPLQRFAPVKHISDFCPETGCFKQPTQVAITFSNFHYMPGNHGVLRHQMFKSCIATIFTSRQPCSMQASMRVSIKIFNLSKESNSIRPSYIEGKLLCPSHFMY